ncbi:MAG: hypothetical protein ACXWQ6_03490 [Candidatus Limnocylindrales bacterium]
MSTGPRLATPAGPAVPPDAERPDPDPSPPTTPEPDAPSEAEGPERRVRDRQVVLLAAAVVIVVLGTQAVGLLVPGFDQLLALQPVMVVVLIGVTLAILAQALRQAVRRR